MRQYILDGIIISRPDDGEAGQFAVLKEGVLDITVQMTPEAAKRVADAIMPTSRIALDYNECKALRDALLAAAGKEEG